MKTVIIYSPVWCFYFIFVLLLFT